MDGQKMSDHQTLADRGAEILARIEKDMDQFSAVLSEAGDTPFEDRKCNNAFARLRRRHHRNVHEIRDFHSDLTECVQTGDVTVQFGGK